MIFEVAVCSDSDKIGYFIDFSPFATSDEDVFYSHLTIEPGRNALV